MESLTPSWEYGLNEAVAQRLVFGKDLVFTFGPYASVYTHLYHPNCVWIMTLGITLVDSLFLLCFGWLVKNARWQWPWILACGLAIPVTSPDAFLFSLPLLVGLIIFKLGLSSKGWAFEDKSIVALISLAFACLGLLPLIKGSLLLLTVGICIACFAFLSGQRRWTTGLICLIAPAISMAFFWVASGQPLIALPGYLSSMTLIISGYTEAMAVAGSQQILLLFMVGAGVMMLSIAIQKGISISQKGFLVFIFALFLFVGFKAGFVRQDLHFSEAMNCLALGSLFLATFHSDVKFSFGSKRLLAITLCATFLAFLPLLLSGAAIEESLVNQTSAGGQSTVGLKGLINNGPKLIHLVSLQESWRLHPWDFRVWAWREEFEQANREINKTSGLNFAIRGTADIYSYEQSSLLARGLPWDPRPVLQSYSAYTPELIRRDEQHLRDGEAPDNLIFRLETIDNRLPSLDDGQSWPAMLDNYSVSDSANEWVLLAKRPGAIRRESKYTALGTVSAELEDDVAVPAATGPIFVEISQRLSTVGKVISLVYKVPSLSLKVTMRNGEASVYRVSANTMETGFLLSPLVISNADFVRLFDSNAATRGDDAVKSIALEVPGERSVCWNKKYTVTFKQYEY
ncbi:hypothetical protein P8935_20510 [Telmatobacter sp. DSM 110680]|uniref:Transmembrane protein n=1 Tax=Telmatobacter sp. DSM 110680 TaxID=3036704 RepID=A0AAU7DHX9_9BACT